MITKAAFCYCFLALSVALYLTLYSPKPVTNTDLDIMAGARYLVVVGGSYIGMFKSQSLALVREAILTASFRNEYCQTASSKIPWTVPSVAN